MMTLKFRYFLPALAVMAMTGAVTTVTPAFAADTPAATGKSAATHEEKADDRIKTLHDQLNITAEQETAFGKLADVMRDNAKNMDAAIAKRDAAQQTPSALDDLKAYEGTAQTQADNVKALIPAFESLYAALSDTQKQQADALFVPGKGGRKHGRKS